MKKFRFILFIFLIAKFSFAQNPDIRRTYHWYFGFGAGIDFTNGSPNAVTNGPLNAREGSAAISDTCGNLLFYTNGDTVWNSIHQVMLNGTGLLGGTTTSSTQSSLIVPQPQTDSIYYIFTTDEWENYGTNGLRYSVVNMNLNGGLGDVIVKNILLFAPCSEKLSAVHHQNGIDYWILGRKWISNEFYAYLLTNTGINLVPINSAIGAIINNGGNGDTGYMHFSPDETKISCAYWDSEALNSTDTVDIFSFNNNTGIISNRIILEIDSQYNVYGTAFSPDNSKLYVSAIKFAPSIVGRIYQYDVSSNNQLIIPTTRKVIAQYDSIMFFAISLAPTGRMLLTKLGILEENSDTLASINFPNLSGALCGFTLNAVSLNGKKSYLGLPNFVDNYFLGNWMPPCPNSNGELNLQNDDFVIYPNPFNVNTTLFLSPYSANSFFSITIYNSVGERVFQQQVSNSSEIALHLNMACGIYFLQLNTGEKIITKKIVLVN